MFSTRNVEIVRQGPLDLGQDVGSPIGGPASSLLFPQESPLMSDMPLQLIVFLLAVGGFTLAAAITDSRFRRIPNKLTFPMFLLGLCFQIGFNGWSGDGTLGGAGLKSALLAFLLGFGSLFVLWMIGSGGAGDVKLMGALSVWLGFQLTLRVFIVTTVVVFFATMALMIWSVFIMGPRKAKSKYLATGKDQASGKKHTGETVAQKQQRRIMAYAIPVAVATWSVILWGLGA
jgi:prepilin peptidase CpaA